MSLQESEVEERRGRCVVSVCQVVSLQTGRSPAPCCTFQVHWDALLSLNNVSPSRPPHTQVFAHWPCFLTSCAFVGGLKSSHSHHAGCIDDALCCSGLYLDVAPKLHAFIGMVLEEEWIMGMSALTCCWKRIRGQVGRGGPWECDVEGSAPPFSTQPLPSLSASCAP